MTLLNSSFGPTREPLQRRFGAILVCIALLSVVLDAINLSTSPRIGSYLFMAALVVIALAVRKTEGGFTSLIGLLFLSTLLFNAAEPIYVALTGDSSIYTISFGTTVEPDGRSLFHLLTFWTVGITCAFGGYFLSATTKKITGRSQLSNGAISFYKRAFNITAMLAGVTLPILLTGRLSAFASGGYTALYSAQANYSFNPTRLLDFLCPLLYALSVLLGEKRYIRIMLVIVLGYIFAGIVVGQRMEAGTWLFVALWHFSTVRRRPMRILPLILALTFAATAFQIINMLRGGFAANRFILVEYFVGQGITFLLPALSWTLASPPVHTVLGSFLPLGALYHLLGVGTAADSNLANYICSQSDPVLFQAGYGLGSSWCMELFYLCGGVMLIYGAASGLLGFLLRKSEEYATRSFVGLFVLCLCLSSIFSLPRGSFNSMTFQVLYGTAFVVVIFFASCAPNISRANGTREEIAYAAN